jgi:hypothetical protein
MIISELDLRDQMVNILDKSDNNLCRESPAAPLHSALRLRSSVDWHMSKLVEC